MALPAIDAVLVTNTQDGVSTADLVSGTFNVAANRTVVVVILYESPVSNTPTTLSWTGSTPTGAAAFVRQAVNGYNDGVGDTQGSEV